MKAWMWFNKCCNLIWLSNLDVLFYCILFYILSKEEQQKEIPPFQIWLESSEKRKVSQDGCPPPVQSPAGCSGPPGGVRPGSRLHQQHGASGSVARDGWVSAQDKNTVCVGLVSCDSETVLNFGLSLFSGAGPGIYRKQPPTEPEPGDPHRSHLKVILNYKQTIIQKPLWAHTSAGFMILVSTKWILKGLQVKKK